MKLKQPKTYLKLFWGLIKNYLKLLFLFIFLLVIAIILSVALDKIFNMLRLSSIYYVPSIISIYITLCFTLYQLELSERQLVKDIISYQPIFKIYGEITSISDKLYTKVVVKNVGKYTAYNVFVRVFSSLYNKSLGSYHKSSLVPGEETFIIVHLDYEKFLSEEIEIIVDYTDIFGEERNIIFIKPQKTGDIFLLKSSIEYKGLISSTIREAKRYLELLKKIKNLEEKSN